MSLKYIVLSDIRGFVPLHMILSKYCDKYTADNHFYKIFRGYDEGKL